MNRTTLGSAAFLVFALVIAWWVLSRPASSSEKEVEVAPSATSAAGLTFAEWAVRGDAVLLADIEPGAGASTVPRRFIVFSVVDVPGTTPDLRERAGFSWAPKDRIESAAALSAQGFNVSVEGAAFTPPSDPLWSETIPRVAGAVEQRVTLRSRGQPEVTATLVRRRGDRQTAAYWDRRAIGFASGDGRFVYVTPDAVIVAATRP